jgi:hypothetical protein
LAAKFRGEEDWRSLHYTNSGSEEAYHISYREKLVLFLAESGNVDWYTVETEFELM